MSKQHEDRSRDATVLPERWITDSPISKRFPLYTRANADEVGPLPFSPLGWSLVWERGCLPGVARGFVEFGVVAFEEYDLDPPQMFGNWGGYFYNPMSLSRLMGVRMPGATAEAIDRAYFGDHPGVPPYEPHPDDESAAASAQLAETMAWVMSTHGYPAQDEAEAMARNIVATRPDLSTLPNEELVARARSVAARVADAWAPYAVVCLAAALGPGAVQAICAGIERSDAAVTVLAAIDNVESAGAALAIWDLSRIVRGSATLGEQFDLGLNDLVARVRALAAHDTAAAAFARGWDALIAGHGHRGPNEWDARPDSWTTRPTIPLDMIDRLRHQDDDRSPHVARDAAAAERERVAEELLAAVADEPTRAALAAGIHSSALFLAMRERGKYACIRLIHEVKLAINELGERMAAAGHVRSRQHVFNLLDAELDAFLADPGSFAATLAERERTFLALHDVEPPYIVGHDTGVPPITTWPRRSAAQVHPAATGEILTGGAGAAGVVRGRARIVLDPEDAPADLCGEDILVAPTTDPSWVPLFLAVRGVVVEVGAVGSHAAIVCRELGVPCAVSVVGATSRITEGAQIEIDGSTGSVTVLAAS